MGAGESYEDDVEVVDGMESMGMVRKYRGVMEEATDLMSRGGGRYKEGETRRQGKE